MQATCDSSEDLDNLFKLRNPSTNDDAEFVHTSMPKVLYAASSLEMDESSFDEDEYDAVMAAEDAEDDDGYVQQYRRVEASWGQAGEPNITTTTTHDSSSSSTAESLPVNDESVKPSAVLPRMGSRAQGVQNRIRGSQ